LAARFVKIAPLVLLRQPTEPLSALFARLVGRNLCQAGPSATLAKKVFSRLLVGSIFAIHVA
jgi:hypothetical protein